jgi:hypothetical protein
MREFNSEDLFDTLLSDWLPNWSLKNWGTKVTIALILTQIINSWTMQAEVQKSNAKSLREFINKVGHIWVSKK